MIKMSMTMWLSVHNLRSRLFSILKFQLGESKSKAEAEVISL